MIWVTGSGRCGTKSFADLTGWPHEPGKWFLGPFSRYAEDGSNEEMLRGFVAGCLESQSPGLVDARFSFVLPLILEADPAAQLIVLFRDPVYTVRSWLSRGAWSKTDQNGAGKVAPPAEATTRAEKCAWYWSFIYERILRHLDPLGPEFVQTEELPIVSNRSASLMRPTTADCTAIVERCSGLYDRLVERILDERPLFDALSATWKAHGGAPLHSRLGTATQ